MSEETQKIDKRTKEYKNQMKHISDEVPESVKDYIGENYEMLKSTGIQCREVIVQRTVRSWTGEPETAFYSEKAKPSRTAQIWFTPHAVIIEQKNDHKRIIPLPNVAYAIPL